MAQETFSPYQNGEEFDPAAFAAAIRREAVAQAAAKKEAEQAGSADAGEGAEQ